jgi:hypothetical protein
MLLSPFLAGVQKAPKLLLHFLLRRMYENLGENLSDFGYRQPNKLLKVYTYSGYGVRSHQGQNMVARLKGKVQRFVGGTTSLLFYQFNLPIKVFNDIVYFSVFDPKNTELYSPSALKR